MVINADIKLLILCDGQGQTTLGGLNLWTQGGTQRMFHQPPLLMRVALQGSQVWIAPIVLGKWCYRSHSLVAVTQLTSVAPQWTGQHQQSSVYPWVNYRNRKTTGKCCGWTTSLSVAECLLLCVWSWIANTSKWCCFYIYQSDNSGNILNAKEQTLHHRERKLVVDQRIYTRDFHYWQLNCECGLNCFT